MEAPCRIRYRLRPDMLLEKKLIPDVILDSFRDVTPEYLRSMGKKLVLCDIDNTLVTYDDPVPTEEVSEWLRSMKDAGINVAFISNNKQDRVVKFAGPTGLYHRYNAGKPKTRELKGAMVHFGTTAEETCTLGDQLLTDAMASKLLGLYTIIVPPIKDKKTAFFRFKRALEKPYIKKYYLRKEEMKNDKDHNEQI